MLLFWQKDLGRLGLGSCSSPVDTDTVHAVDSGVALPGSVSTKSSPTHLHILRTAVLVPRLPYQVVRAGTIVLRIPRFRSNSLRTMFTYIQCVCVCLHTK